MRRQALPMVAICLVTAILSLSPFGIRLEENVGLDLLYRMRGDRPVPPGAAVIALDEAAIAWLRRTSSSQETTAPSTDACLDTTDQSNLGTIRNATDLPRPVLGCIVSHAADLGAALIILDINLAVETAQDADLAATLKAAGNVLLLEKVERLTTPEGTDRSILLRQSPSRVLARSALATAGFQVESAPGRVTIRYPALFDGFPDLSPMPVEVYRRMGHTPGDLPPRVLFNLYGPPWSVPTWSVRALFDPGVDRPDIKGVAVFIGASGRGPEARLDGFAVPAYSGAQGHLSGVELAATAYLNLLHGQGLWEPKPASRAILAAVLTFIFSIVGLNVRSWRALVLIAGCCMLVASAAVAAFANGIWLPVAVPVFFGAPLAGLWVLESRLLFLRRTASSLVPRGLADRILEGGPSSSDQAAGTAIFIDIAGSTGLAERLGPRENDALLSAYYELVGKQVEDHDGAIYFLAGDGMLAVFIARGDADNPATLPFGGYAMAVSARCAVNAALAIQSDMRRLWSKTGFDPINLRIGIASGPIVTGALRYGDRLSVQASGDTINRAFRLQEIGKQEAGKLTAPDALILLDSETVSDLGAMELDLRGWRKVTLRGGKKATTVYRLHSEGMSAASPVVPGM